jgi:Fe-S-cluster containining protein
MRGAGNEAGLTFRFECQGCGACCRKRGECVYVYLTLRDRRRLAAHLGLPTRTFTARYTEKDDGEFVLRQPGEECPFLCGDFCTVYEARPDQCRTWPFWAENLDPAVWEIEVASFCPGAGRGKLYTVEDIQSILRRRSET